VAVRSLSVCVRYNVSVCVCVCVRVCVCVCMRGNVSEHAKNHTAWPGLFRTQTPPPTMPVPLKGSTASSPLPRIQIVCTHTRAHTPTHTHTLKHTHARTKTQRHAHTRMHARTHSAPVLLKVLHQLPDSFQQVGAPLVLVPPVPHLQAPPAAATVTCNEMRSHAVLQNAHAR
jgi:hypothetical protein